MLCKLFGLKLMNHDIRISLSLRQKAFLFINWGGIFGTMEVISAKLSTGEVTGAHLSGALGQDVLKRVTDQSGFYFSLVSNVLITFFPFISANLVKGLAPNITWLVMLESWK